MSEKSDLFIDVEKRLVGTFVSFSEDQENPERKYIEFVPLATSIAGLFPFSFGDSTIKTPYSVGRDDYMWLEPNEPTSDVIRPGYEGRMLIVQREQGAWAEKRMKNLEQDKEQLEDELKAARSEIQSLKQELEEARNEKEKSSREGSNRRRTGLRDIR